MIRLRLSLFCLLCLVWLAGRVSVLPAQHQQSLLNEPVDLSPDFLDHRNTYFLTDSLVSFDPQTGVGTLRWDRARYTPAHAFNYIQHGFRAMPQNEFPAPEYAQGPALPFAIQFIDSRTVRLQLHSGPVLPPGEPSLMLVAEPQNRPGDWAYTRLSDGHQYQSPHARVIVRERPWAVEFYDATGRLLTQTRHSSDNMGFCANMPFAFVRRAADYSRSMGAVFELSPGEKIFGCGESFTGFDKYGQQVNLYTCDPNGVETPGMYKPIPFFLSSRSYGMFMHTSSPITCNFGKT
ncbi:MAG: hypothetical protein OHK0039_38920 [Bacteroidia bacterium]